VLRSWESLSIVIGYDFWIVGGFWVGWVLNSRRVFFGHV